MNAPLDTRTYFEDIGAWPRSSRMALAYVSGFILSLALTLCAYILAMHGMLTTRGILGLGTLAIAQFFVQIFLFLHLGRDRAVRDRYIVFWFAFVVVAIILSGSLWIMLNLAPRMNASGMTMDQMMQYMQDQNGGI